jgi:hypothetical protein
MSVELPLQMALLATCRICGKPGGISIHDNRESRRDFVGMDMQTLTKDEALRRWNEGICCCHDAPEVAEVQTLRATVARLESEKRELESIIRGRRTV